MPFLVMQIRDVNMINLVMQHLMVVQVEQADSILAVWIWETYSETYLETSLVAVAQEARAMVL